MCARTLGPHLLLFGLIHLACSLRIKSYNLNQFTSQDPVVDCVHSARTISLPKEFTICYRYKKLFNSGLKNQMKWGHIFLGSIENGIIDYGIFFGIWSWSPWLGVADPKMNWVGFGYNAEPSLLTWRHTCLVTSLRDGTFILYENGKRISKKKIKFYEELGEKYPNFTVPQIFVGCDPIIKDIAQSHPGIVTDFQIFNGKLEENALEEWTSCKERIEGDLLSWDTEEWVFNKTGNGSNIEYIDFHNDICLNKTSSYQLFPSNMNFKKTLDLCKKVGGRMNE